MNEKKLAEEYCWAITQAAGRSHWADQVPMFWSSYFNWAALYIWPYLYSVKTCAVSSGPWQLLKSEGVCIWN